MNWGKHQPFLDYRVNPDWISAHVQACQLEPGDAKLEFLLTWKNCKMHIESIDWNVRWRTKRDLDVALLSEQGAIQAVRGQRKWFHEVDDVWLPLMGEVSDRHRVLVLGGRSRVGKTTFCKFVRLRLGTSS